MFDSSLSFKKSNKNEYEFRNGYLYTSRAYIVNRKEKNEIEKILNECSYFILMLSAAMVIPIKKSPNYCIPLYGLIFLYKYLKCYKAVKKILNGRKKRLCSKLSFITHQKKIAASYTWRFLFEHLVSVPALLFVAWFLLTDYAITHKLFEITFGILFLLGSIFLFINTIIWMYLKLRQ